MKLLLDTHVAIWAGGAPERIPRSIRNTINANAGAVWVSAAAIWEVAIKHPLKRPDAPPISGHEAIIEFQTTGFALLDVTPQHAAMVERLPPIHADPFDRLMLAQAMIEGMQFVTYDKRLSRYGTAILTWP